MYLALSASAVGGSPAREEVRRRGLTLGRRPTAFATGALQLQSLLVPCCFLTANELKYEVCAVTQSRRKIREWKPSSWYGKAVCWIHNLQESETLETMSNPQSHSSRQDKTARLISWILNTKYSEFPRRSLLDLFPTLKPHTYWTSSFCWGSLLMVWPEVDFVFVCSRCYSRVRSHCPSISVSRQLGIHRNPEAKKKKKRKQIQKPIVGRALLTLLIKDNMISHWHWLMRIPSLTECKEWCHARFSCHSVESHCPSSPERAILIRAIFIRTKQLMHSRTGVGGWLVIVYRKVWTNIFCFVVVNKNMIINILIKFKRKAFEYF